MLTAHQPQQPETYLIKPIHALTAFLLYVGAITIFYSFFNAYTHNPDAIGDWLINYQYGFVRRGLWGWIHSVWAIAAIQVILYAIILFCFWHLLQKQQWNLWLLLLTVSPATLSFPIFDHAAEGRKEILYLAAFAVFVAMLNNGKTKWLNTYLAIILPICILSHELTIFFMPYFFIAALIGGFKVGRLPIITSLIATVAVILHPGNALMAHKICQSVGMCNGSISYLSDDPSVALERVRKVFFQRHYYIVYPFALFLAIFPALELWPRAWLTFIPTLPLFFLGTDWGRWIYINMMSLFLLLLLMQRKSRSKPNLIFIVLYALFWNAPLCCYFGGMEWGYLGLFKRAWHYMN